MRRKKTMHWLGVLVIALIAVSLIVVGCAKPAPPPEEVAPTPPPEEVLAPPPEEVPPAMEPVTLLFNAYAGSEPSAYGKAITWFGNEVTKRTNGLVKFDYAWSFSLTKPGEGLESLEKGASDLLLFIMPYQPSKLYLNNVTYAVPFVPSDLTEQSKIVAKLWDEVPALIEELEKYNAKFFWVQGQYPYMLQSTMPITKLDDLKGKKIAISGVYAPKWLELTGAVALPTPLPDRVVGLETGMLDGSILGPNISYLAKLYQFCPYAIDLGLGSWIDSAIVMKLDLFNSFPEDIQQIIVEVGREGSSVWYQALTSEYDQIMNEWEEAGVTISRLPDEDIVKFAKLIGNSPGAWVDEGEAMGKPAREVMEKYLALIAETGHRFPVEWESMPK